MKLIAEITESVEFIVEAAKEGKDKSYYIKGPFMQAEVKNKNNRMYPKNVLMKEVSRYNDEYVNKKRAYGELGHPQGPTINLDRVSHMIIELTESGNDFIGKAKVLNTPYGQIVKNLIDEGASLGVSSRGMGSLKDERGYQVVQDDYRLSSAADIVADPSAPNAFVQGIMEGKEWIWNNGIWTEQEIAEQRRRIDNSNRRDRDKAILESFTRLISKF
jgi:hypothetical protein